MFWLRCGNELAICNGNIPSSGRLKITSQCCSSTLEARGIVPKSIFINHYVIIIKILSAPNVWLIFSIHPMSPTPGGYILCRTVLVH